MFGRFGVILALLAMPGALAAQEIDASFGGGYSSGRYGAAEPTELVSAYLSLGVTHEGWRLDATLPYLSLASGGEPVDVGGVTLPGGQRSSGLGDATIRVSRFMPFAGSFGLGVAAQVKLPTGDASLTTGKVDADLEVELSKDIGRFSPFVGARYSAYGDSAFLALSDTWSLSAGTSVTFGRSAVIAAYDWSQSSVGGPAAHEVGATFVTPLSSRWLWTAYASKGFSPGAADVSLGAGITRVFGGSGRAPLEQRRRN